MDSDRTQNLVEKKRTARINHDMDQYKELNRRCKKLARQDKQNWAESKAIQGEAYLATGQIKDAFAHFRNLRGSELLAHGRSRPFSMTMATL